MNLKQFAFYHNTNTKAIRAHIKKHKDAFEKHITILQGQKILDNTAINMLEKVYPPPNDYHFNSEILLILKQNNALLKEIIKLKKSKKGFWEKLFDKFGLTF